MRLKLIISFFLFFSSLGYSKNKEIFKLEVIEYEISKVFSYDGIIWSIEFLNESDTNRKNKITRRVI
jgi:hypothetical protein